jgi:hypothetical protein
VSEYGTVIGIVRAPSNAPGAIASRTNNTVNRIWAPPTRKSLRNSNSRRSSHGFALGTQCQDRTWVEHMGRQGTKR